MKTLLKEEIELLENLILEFKTNFNWNEFKKQEDAYDRLVYVQDKLPFLGQGSSRAVFTLPNLGYALKIATNAAGHAQNEAEVDVYTNPKSRPIVAKIKASAPDYSWIVSELTRPLSISSKAQVKHGNIGNLGKQQAGPNDEFERLTGVPFYMVVQALDGQLEPYQIAQNPFLSALMSTKQENNLQRGDLESIGHYGKTADGRVVLLDYGFTHDVLKKHYNKPQPRPEDKTNSDSPTKDKTVDVTTGDLAKTNKPGALRRPVAADSVVTAKPAVKNPEDSIVTNRPPRRAAVPQ